MSSTSSTSEKQSSLSSCNFPVLPDSDPQTSYLYTNSSKSPSLQAFYSFEEALAQFHSHFLTKYDEVGHVDVDTMRAILEALDKKCGSMEKTFADFISRLDDAIERYETKKPTDLAADANSVISQEKPERNRASLFKADQTIKQLFDVLNRSIAKIRVVIGKKVRRSMYEDYSFSLDKKLKNLKAMCEDTNKELERIRKNIKKAIDENNTFNDG